MPYPIIPVGVVAGKAMIDGGYKTKTNKNTKFICD